MIYNHYFFRTTDRDALIAIGMDLQLLQLDDEGTVVSARPDLAWDEVGFILDEEGNPLSNEEGQPFFHANMSFGKNLREHAMELFAETGDERIMEHVASAMNFFVLDEEGNPRPPNSPMRVFL